MLVDIGRGAGKLGGEVIAQGTADEISKNPNSLTGDYLSGKKFIEVPAVRRSTENFLEFENLTANNLKNISVKIPLEVLTSTPLLK